MTKGLKGFQKGQKFTEEHKKKLSKARMGKSPWNKGLKGYQAGVKHPWMARGKNHYHWKGGITPLYIKIRNSPEGRLWRKAVFERDNYTCVWCGIKFIKGVTGRVILNADHIKPFAFYPELRFAIDNGRTLCKKCHETTDTYRNIKKI